MIILAVTWLAKPGSEAEAAHILSILTEESRRESGCLMYQVHRHKSEAGRFFIYEQYKDDDALEAHRQTPHFLKWARTELPKVAERVDADLYDPLS
jgi:quinol monooxygenase YgiN